MIFLFCVFLKMEKGIWLFPSFFFFLLRIPTPPSIIDYSNLMATHFDRLQHPRGMSKDGCVWLYHFTFLLFSKQGYASTIFFPPLLFFVGYHNNFSLNIYMLICASSLSAHPRYLFIYLLFFFLSYLFGLIISPILKIHPFFFAISFLCCLIIEIRLQSMSRYFVVFVLFFF